MAIRKVCVARGCDDLAVEGGAHCPHHEAEKLEKLDRSRKAAKLTEASIAGRELYAGKWWKVEAARFLEANPLCVDCAELGLTVPAEEVDHIKPHRGDRTLFRDRRNWQALCHSCHSRKTAREVFAGRSRKPGGV